METSNERMADGSTYLCQVEVVLLHIHQMVPDQEFHGLHVVFILITTFYQTPVNTPEARLKHTPAHAQVSPWRDSTGLSPWLTW